MLKGTHLPVEIKEIQVGYLHSPYFKEIYQYLLQNKLPHSKLAIKKLEASQKGHRYILCDIDEVANFLITVQIFQARSEEVEKVACYNKTLYT